MIPPKLKPGDEIRVIAPSRSLSILSEEQIKEAQANFEKQGFRITFSRNCRESDIFDSSSIQSRVQDLHEAFADHRVKAIFTAIGGFNANQILEYLDYQLIADNPKILCGYSDITALTNAITAKTGLITYSGLHFSTWQMRKGFDYNLSYFQKCLIDDAEFAILPSDTWSDDAWYIDQENRNFIENEGFITLNPGEAQGTIWGGNLCTLNLLQGTKFMPDISGSLLFIEDDDFAGAYFDVEFDRNLQSLIHQPNFDKVQGIVIGRFQEKSAMNTKKLKHIIKTKSALSHIPIIANVDFGHTNPLITFPIGGTAQLKGNNKVELKIIQH
ncbi:LD-carboxypeptidase [Candidatus Peregrinibacteria bacterium HGW-Peregrinibacteria-1]|nr:MAG: LD-carboxypeptidase [Candidatus Peregrinibacteria bacterium HGW-Peregrinibacteria-1]